MPLLEGYLTGLALVVLIGPVLFVLLRSTLERGRAAGLAVALGIFASDVLAVALCALGLASRLQDPRVGPWLAGAGGLLLLGFGGRYLIAPALAPPEDGRLSALTLAGFFGRGFLVNFVNPFVFMVWIGIVGLGATRHGAGPGLAAYLVGAVLGILTLDLTKVLLAHRLRPLLAPRALAIVLRVSGVLLLGFGVRLLVTALGA